MAATDKKTTPQILQRIKEWILQGIPTRIITPETTTITILPDKLYKWGKVSELAISFGGGTTGMASHYMFEFSCPDSTTTQLSLPDGIKWANDNELEPESGCTYQVSILDNLAVYAEWEGGGNE